MWCIFFVFHTVLLRCVCVNNFRTSYSLWEKTYESLSEFVVPRSSRWVYDRFHSLSVMLMYVYCLHECLMHWTISTFGVNVSVKWGKIALCSWPSASSTVLSSWWHCCHTEKGTLLVLGASVKLLAERKSVSDHSLLLLAVSVASLNSSLDHKPGLSRIKGHNLWSALHELREYVNCHYSLFRL